MSFDLPEPNAVGLMPPGEQPQLVLRDLEDRHGDGDVWSFVAEPATSGLTAASDVTILRGHGLSEFFALSGMHPEGDLLSDCQCQPPRSWHPAVLADRPPRAVPRDQCHPLM